MVQPWKGCVGANPPRVRIPINIISYNIVFKGYIEIFMLFYTTFLYNILILRVILYNPIFTCGVMSEWSMV